MNKKIFIIFFLFNSFLYSEEIPETYLDKIVVTANRFSEKEKQIPIKITVLEKKEIEESTAKNVAELLNQKLPYYVKESPGLTGTFWIHGMKSDDSGASVSSRVLILMNGHPSGSGILDSIPLLSIEKIEIIAGPFSVTYGSGALAGVVNIITTKKGPNSIKAAIETGSYDYSKAEFQTQFNLEKVLSIVASAGSEQRGNYDIGVNRFGEKDKYNTKANGVNYKNTDYKYDKAYLGFSLNQPSWFLEGSLQYFNTNHVGAPNGFYSNDLNDYVDSSRFLADLYFSSDFSDTLKFLTTAYYNQNSRNNYGVAPPYQYDFHLKMKEAGLSPQFKAKFDFYELITGGNLDSTHLQKNGNAYSEPDTIYLSTGLFLENHFLLMQKLDFWLGGRYDFYEAQMKEGQGILFQSSNRKSSFNHLSYRGGLAYSIQDFIVKFYTGSGFTAPSLMQLAGEYTGPWTTSGTKTFKGNPDLKAEESFSYQATLGYQGKHSFLLTYCYQIIKNRISADYTIEPYTYKNINKTMSQFIEADSKINWGNLLKVKNVFGYLSLKGSYQLKYKDEQTGETAAVYLPETKINTSLTIGYFELFSFYADYIYTGKMIDGASYNNIGDFHLVHMGIDLTPFLFIDSKSKYAPIKLSFQIKNLFDTQYEFVDGYPMPGREYRFGVSYEYKF